MNDSARIQPLIIGIGNPLRSDDGLGWAVAEQLSRDNITGYKVRTVHQLTPELAQWMAIASIVVMIDASREGDPGEIRIRPLPLTTQHCTTSTHYTTPEELAALTIAVYGQCPPAVLVTLTGSDFSLGEKFSPIVEQRIPIIRETVGQLCSVDVSLIEHIIK
jgi:hydrogenase maturation protease